MIEPANNPALGLRQRKLVAREIGQEYRKWRRKLRREPTEEERRQIVAIGFSKARRKMPSIPQNPEMIYKTAAGRTMSTVVPGHVTVIPSGDELERGGLEASVFGAEVIHAGRGVGKELNPGHGASEFHHPSPGELWDMMPYEQRVGTLVKIGVEDPVMVEHLALTRWKGLDVAFQDVLVGALRGRSPNPLTRRERHHLEAEAARRRAWAGHMERTGSPVAAQVHGRIATTIERVAAGKLYPRRRSKFWTYRVGKAGDVRTLTFEKPVGMGKFRAELRKVLGRKRLPVDLKFWQTTGPYPPPPPAPVDWRTVVEPNPSFPAAMIGGAVGGIVANALNPTGFPFSGPTYYRPAYRRGKTIIRRRVPLTGEMRRDARSHFSRYAAAENPLNASEAAAYLQSIEERVRSGEIAERQGDREAAIFHYGHAKATADSLIEDTSERVFQLRQQEITRANRRTLDKVTGVMGRVPGVQANPTLMTVMGANPCPPYCLNPKHGHIPATRKRRRNPVSRVQAAMANPKARKRKVTMSLERFWQVLKKKGDPRLIADFKRKIAGYQKWTHGSLPSKVTVEMLDVPGVSGLWMTYGMGRQPESMYVMPTGSKRKGAWRHPWTKMPHMKGDPQSGLILTKLVTGNKITDFLHG